MRSLTDTLFSFDLFIVLSFKLAFEGALRVGILVDECDFSVEDHGAELERATKVTQSQRVNNAFSAEFFL